MSIVDAEVFRNTENANLYAKHRPKYPTTIFNIIRNFFLAAENDGKRSSSGLSDSHELLPYTALDIGCGPGNSTFDLAHTFRYVIGIDPSLEQLEAMKLKDYLNREIPQASRLEFHALGLGEFPSKSKDIFEAAIQEEPEKLGELRSFKCWKRGASSAASPSSTSSSNEAEALPSTGQGVVSSTHVSITSQGDGSGRLDPQVIHKELHEAHLQAHLQAHFQAHHAQQAGHQGLHEVHLQDHWKATQSNASSPQTSTLQNTTDSTSPQPTTPPLSIDLMHFGQSFQWVDYDVSFDVARRISPSSIATLQPHHLPFLLAASGYHFGHFINPLHIPTSLIEPLQNLKGSAYAAPSSPESQLILDINLPANKAVVDSLLVQEQEAPSNRILARIFAPFENHSRIVDRKAEFKHINFPYAHTRRFAFYSIKKITIEDYFQYLDTWSFIKNNRQQLKPIMEELSASLRGEYGHEDDSGEVLFIQRFFLVLASDCDALLGLGGVEN